MKRNIYLKTIPPAEAVARVKASIDREALIREETIPSHEASGRVLAHAVHARYPLCLRIWQRTETRIPTAAIRNIRLTPIFFPHLHQHHCQKQPA